MALEWACVLNYIVCFTLGLPVQVRDEALNIHSEAPNSDVNRQYYAQNIAGKVYQSTKSFNMDL